MTATAALSRALLKGHVLSIKSAFFLFGITNLPRECGRSIERKFGVRLARVPRNGKSKYGIACTWYEYRLPKTPYNAEGRKKMIEYVKKEKAKAKGEKTMH